jgi:pyruvate carboxylase subunit A
MIHKILVANRGEIAVRVLRACRELGIRSVAVFSEADKEALFVRHADESFLIGPSPASQSYLDIQKIIDRALHCGADAIHPGYGFLAENPKLAYACEQQGLTFIGPSGRVLELVGDKIAARREMIKAGIPVVPGTEECVADVESAGKIARSLGYPVIIKPAGGGGGIGMTVVAGEMELESALQSTQAIAANAFGIGEVYLEKYLANPRHIEFQVLADSQGNVIHLGERECSIQRRHQKLIEESPSTAITPQLRARMGTLAAQAARSVGYEGAGTVEFLFSDSEFYYLEVNARIQVEHPVTEMVTGIDIVKEQIRIASGSPLRVRQESIRFIGNAIECRINAEDPLDDFAPAPGRIGAYHAPGGPGIRVDSGVFGSYTIPPFYDPMISKLIAWGCDREEAIARMRRALEEYVVTGVKSNIPFHLAVMANPRFAAGDLSTQFIDREPTLIDGVREFAEQQRRRQNNFARQDMKKRVAAIAVAAAIGQMQEAPKQDAWK